MRGFYGTIIALLIITVSLTACTKDDPRASVGSVRTPLNEEVQKALLTLVSKDTLKGELEESLLSVSMSERGGSGFLVSDHEHEGQHLFITNRHVIEDGSHPEISFDDGKTISVSEILYKDPTHDIAILLFKKTDKDQKGLELESSYVDTDSVSALGYPVTKNTGTFQITKGTISDSCLKNKQLEGQGDSQNAEACWIKHTAEFDTGSSGGPLIKTSSNIMGSASAVIGVNTAYIANKHGAFLAIPSEIVEHSIDYAEDVLEHRSDASWRSERLRRACQQFIEEITSSSPNVLFLQSKISNKLLAQQGHASLTYLMERANILQRLQMHNNLTENDPLDIYKAVILNHIAVLFKGGGGIPTGERCGRVNENDDVVKPDGTVRIRAGLVSGETIELTWSFEENDWRLNDFNRL